MHHERREAGRSKLLSVHSFAKYITSIAEDVITRGIVLKAPVLVVLMDQLTPKDYRSAGMSLRKISIGPASHDVCSCGIVL
jgi:hypothetical protein